MDPCRGTPKSAEFLSLHRQFEGVVRRNPNDPALRFGSSSISYGCLDEQANRLAQRLRSEGVQREVPVAISIERGPALVVAFVAVLKAGGACVPLDERQTDARLLAMLEESAAPLLLTAGPLRRRWIDQARALNCRLLDVDSSLETFDDARPATGARDGDTGFVLYTSGSTGRPKGVMMTYRGRTGRQDWTQARYPAGPDDVHLLKAPSGFNTIIREIFWPLTTGGCLVIAEPDGDRSPSYLVKTIADYGVTIVNLVPSVLRAVLDEPELSRCQRLRRVFATGEPVTVELQERFFERLPWSRLHTFYGSTEAPTATAWDFDPDQAERFVTLGTPTDQDVHVLDQHLRPVALGEIGEVYIAGSGLARGYHRRPDLTAERFVPCPFGGTPDTIMFRTGDLARLRSGGQLEYEGRADQQLKIRGCRVEPGEVEVRLTRHPDVDRCVVGMRVDRGQQRLVAWFVPRDPAATATPDALRRFVGAALPSYMTPFAYVPLAALPIGLRGKLDRSALEDPRPEHYTGRGRQEPPTGPVEESLAEIFSTTARLERVGRWDSFVELGGSSLEAMSILSQIRERFGKQISVRTFFEAPTVADLARALEDSPEQIDEETDASASVATLQVQALVDGLGPAEQTILIDTLARGEVPEQPDPSRSALRRCVAESDPPIRGGPMTAEQASLWYLEQRHAERPPYNVSAVHRIRGALSVPALRAALDQLATRHAALRTMHIAVEGKPVQLVVPTPTVQLDIDDWSDRGLTEAVLEVQEMADKAIDLRRPLGPTARLLRLAPRDHILVINLHHIVCDGWSRQLMYRELSELYAARANGRPPTPSTPQANLIDYAYRQKRYAASDRSARSIAWWTQQLADPPAPPDLSGLIRRPRARRPSDEGRADRCTITLPPTLVGALRTLSQTEGVSLFTTLLATFALSLSRRTGTQDLLVGVPMSGRNRTDLESVVGCFVNMLALRFAVPPDLPFTRFLAQCSRTVLDAFTHASLPFDRVVGALRPARSAERNPLFDVVFNHVGFPRPGLSLENLDCERLDVRQPAHHALSMYVLDDPRRPESEGLPIRLVYRSGQFDRALVEELLQQYRTTLEQIAQRPQSSVQAISLRTARASAVLADPYLELDLPMPEPVTRTFETVAAAYPHAEAIRWREHVLRYGEVAEHVAHLAGRLLQRGVEPGQTIAVLGERCPGLVIAALAVWRIHGVLLPVDSTLPQLRIRQLLGSAKPDLLLRLRSSSDAAESMGPDLLPHDVDQVVLSAETASPIQPASQPAAPVPSRSALPEHPAAEAPAYIFFTSGSSGPPRAILGCHRGPAQFLQWERAHLAIDANDRLPLLNALSFDPVLRDMLLPLTSGATLCIPGSASDVEPDRVLDWIAAEKITVIHTVPALAHAWVSNVLGSQSQLLPHLRWLLLSGEPLSSHVVRRWRSVCGTHVRVINLYGTTECTMVQCFNEVSDPVTEELQLAGRAVPGWQVLVVSVGGQLCGVGEPGEIIIRSPFMTLGYLHASRDRPDGFIANPFRADSEDRAYRTGDLGRYRIDGKLEVLGRMDRQLKIRGARVEPFEIETLLLACPGVRQAAVTVRRDLRGEPRLLAYVSGTTLQVDALAAWLRERLPGYMVPARLVVLDQLPHNTHGKLDRAALPDVDSTRPELRATYVPPRTPDELQLAQLWQELLGLDDVGVLDDFFDLGGHSLLVIELVSLIERELGWRPAVADLFPDATIEHLARAKKRRAVPSKAETFKHLLPIQPRGTRPPLFCVHPAGGSALCYIELARHLGKAQPFYGLQGPAPNTGIDPFASVEEMAAAYLAEIVTVADSRPILLAGHSFGGLVAFEIAAQLRALGREVGFVAMFDTGAPYNSGLRGGAGIVHSLCTVLGSHDLQTDSSVAEDHALLDDLAGLSARYLAWNEQEVEHSRDRRRRSGRGRALNKVQEFFSIYRFLPTTEVSDFRQLRTFMYYLHANLMSGRNYRPRKAELPVVFFRAVEQVTSDSPDSRERSEGWSSLSSVPVDYHPIEGNHLNMLGAPAVHQLASVLSTHIDRFLEPQ